MPFEELKKEIGKEKVINEELRKENCILFEKSQALNEIIRKKDEEISYYKDNLLRKMNEENHELNKKNRELHM